MTRTDYYYIKLGRPTNGFTLETRDGITVARVNVPGPEFVQMTEIEYLNKIVVAASNSDVVFPGYPNAG